MEAIIRQATHTLSVGLLGCTSHDYGSKSNRVQGEQSEQAEQAEQAAAAVDEEEAS